MTQKEFFTRTNVALTAEQYETIEALYMSSELDKDDFCKEFKKFYTATHKQQVAKQKAEAKALKEFMKKSTIERASIIIADIAEKRVAETKSSLIMYDLKIDTDELKATFGKQQDFEFFFILRDHGTQVTYSIASARKYAVDFKSSNPTIYKVHSALNCIYTEEVK